MTMFERQAFVQAESFRSLAEQYLSGHLGEGLPQEAREAVHSAFRFAADTVVDDALLCGVCTGRGVEWAPPYEDEDVDGPSVMVPGAWYECWRCKGSGRSDNLRCARCGCAEEPVFCREVDGENWCMSCASVDRLLQEHGKRFTVALEPPFGGSA